MNITRFYSHKGGSGTSTVAVAFAVTRAAQSRKVLLVEIAEHESHTAILGHTTPPLGAVVPAKPNLHTLWVRDNWSTSIADFEDYDDVIVDGGQELPNDTNYLVIRPCYIALRHAVRHPDEPRNGVIVVSEKGRALNEQDVKSVLDTEVVATMDVDPIVARAIDAGLLGTRLANLAPLASVRRLAESLPVI